MFNGLGKFVGNKRSFNCIKKNPAVNGKCGSTHYNCTAGNATSTHEYTDRGEWSWMCEGTNGGSVTSCSEFMSGYPECSTEPGKCKKGIWPSSIIPSGERTCYYAGKNAKCFPSPSCELYRHFDGTSPGQGGAVSSSACNDINDSQVNSPERRNSCSKYHRGEQAVCGTTTRYTFHCQCKN